MDKKMLFTPGPVMTTDAAKRALMHPDMPHRRPAFEAVFRKARQHIKLLLNADQRYEVALISGSGSAANETALSSIVKPKDEVLVINNGPFADRLEEILQCYQLKVHRLVSPWGTLPDVKAAEKILKDNPAITWLAVVFHETGSGMRNPVRELTSVAHGLGRKTFVDCVSAFGAEDIDVVRDHIDVCTSVGNKAVGGMTGVSFVVANTQVVPPLGPDMPRRNMYLNLQNHLRWASEHEQTPNTPAVTMMVALDHALQEIIDEKLENRIKRCQACAKVVRDGARALGLKLLLPDEQFSNTVTSIFLPEGIKVDDFIDELDDRGYVVYPGKGIFHDKNVFQVANMGTIQPSDCQKLMTVVGETIQDMKRAAA